VGENLHFDIDKTVSLFETNIRVMGGLLSAHLLASDEKTVQTQALFHHYHRNHVQCVLRLIVATS
jgi:mannosidase alpha-like ER degradation enhancer 2